MVNGTDGGDQCIGVPKTAAHKAAISAALVGRKSPWTAERNRQNKGKPGHPVSPEAKAKISASNKDREKPWLAERNRDLVWTEEMRAKIGDANRKISLDTVRKIKRQLEADEVQAAIARQHGVSTSLVSQIKRGKRYAKII